jgi:Uma2 family endonuclease
MVLTQRRMTADEFLALPPDNSKTQLIDGELVMTDVRLRHQRLAGELFRLLANWLVDHPGVGQAGYGCNWRMDDDNVFIPDGWFMAGPTLDDRVWFDGPPDLVIEVRSPSTWRFDIGRKREAYLAGGAEVWLVDTAADEVLVFRGDEALELGAGDTLTTPLIPGFELDLTTLFAR